MLTLIDKLFDKRNDFLVILLPITFWLLLWTFFFNPLAVKNKRNFFRPNGSFDRRRHRHLSTCAMGSTRKWLGKMGIAFSRNQERETKITNNDHCAQ